MLRALDTQPIESVGGYHDLNPNNWINQSNGRLLSTGEHRARAPSYGEK